jgi:hypothetical protein
MGLALLGVASVVQTLFHGGPPFLAVSPSPILRGRRPIDRAACAAAGTASRGPAATPPARRPPARPRRRRSRRARLRRPGGGGVAIVLHSLGCAAPGGSTAHTDHPLPTAVEAESIARTTRGGTVAMLMDAVRHHAALRRRSLAGGVPLRGCSANPSMAGMHLCVEDVVPEIVRMARVVIDRGCRPFHPRAQSIRLLDAGRLEILRAASCREDIAQILEKPFGHHPPPRDETGRTAPRSGGSGRRPSARAPAPLCGRRTSSAASPIPPSRRAAAPMWMPRWGPRRGPARARAAGVVVPRTCVAHAEPEAPRWKIPAVVSALGPVTAWSALPAPTRMPMSTARRSNPAASCGWPRVKRTSPVIGPPPTRAGRTPGIPGGTPSTTETLETVRMRVVPRQMGAKVPVGARRSATAASRGAARRSPIAGTSPPKTGAAVARDSASPARPMRAGGRPSSTVAATAGVPGVSMRMADTAPRWTERAWMAGSRGIVGACSIDGVKGGTSATATMEPIPGRAPGTMSSPVPSPVPSPLPRRGVRTPWGVRTSAAASGRTASTGAPASVGEGRGRRRQAEEMVEEDHAPRDHERRGARHEHGPAQAEGRQHRVGERRGRERGAHPREAPHERRHAERHEGDPRRAALRERRAGAGALDLDREARCGEVPPGPEPDGGQAHRREGPAGPRKSRTPAEPEVPRRRREEKGGHRDPLGGPRRRPAVSMRARSASHRGRQRASGPRWSISVPVIPAKASGATAASQAASRVARVASSCLAGAEGPPRRERSSGGASMPASAAVRMSGLVSSGPSARAARGSRPQLDRMTSVSPRNWITPDRMDGIAASGPACGRWRRSSIGPRPVPTPRSW